MLAVTSPTAGSTVPEATHRFEGTVEPGCEVWAWNKWQANTTPDGSWSIALTLDLGPNLVRFNTADAAGNETSIETTVIYEPPLMPCHLEDDGHECCGGWGDITSVNLDRSEIVFDLHQFVSTGPEEYEFEFVNNNPLLRTLRVAHDVEILACPPRPGETVPSPACGSPRDFVPWSLSDLAGFVAAGADWWRIGTQDGPVVQIEQWWWP